MQPIVNGLKPEYQQNVDFIDLNAADGAEGQATFELYQLRGHPTVMIVLPDGEIAWTKSGVVSREEIERAILNVIDQ